MLKESFYRARYVSGLDWHCWRFPRWIRELNSGRPSSLIWNPVQLAGVLLGAKLASWLLLPFTTYSVVASLSQDLLYSRKPEIVFPKWNLT